MTQLFGVPDPGLDLARWLDDARAGSAEALGRLFETCRQYLLLVANQQLGPEARGEYQLAVAGEPVPLVTGQGAPPLPSVGVPQLQLGLARHPAERDGQRLAVVGQGNGPHPGMNARLDGRLYQELPPVRQVPLPLFD